MLKISVSCQQVLEEDGSTDLALVAEIAAIPSEAALSDAIAAAGAPVDPVAVHRNRSELAGAIGSAMRDRLRRIYDAQYAAQRAQQLDGDTGSVAVGRRAIANLASGESGLPPDCVASAHDGLVLPIFQPDREKPVLPPEALTA